MDCPNKVVFNASVVEQTHIETHRIAIIEKVKKNIRIYNNQKAIKHVNDVIHVYKVQTGFWMYV